MIGEIRIDAVELSVINEPALLETAGLSTSHAGLTLGSYRNSPGPAIHMEGLFVLTAKPCTKCGIEKELSEFYTDKRMKDGVRSRCKACVIEDKAQYWRENKEKLRVRQSEYNRKYIAKSKAKISAHAAIYYAQNRERLRAVSKAYLASHREENKRYCKEYYAANRERERQRALRWHAENPEKHRAAGARRRARLLQAGGEHTAEDIKRQGNVQKWRCWWCGKKCKKQYHVDHLVPLAQGGHNGPSNLVIACPKCNLSKSDNMPCDWAGKLF